MEQLSGEEWRPIPGHEETYEVSSLGDIRSARRKGARGGLLKQRVGKRGYLIVALVTNGRQETRTVHSLVALAFLGARPAENDVRHLDGNRLNCTLANLAYGTRSENQRDKRRHGTDHNAAKTHCPKGHPYDETNMRVTPIGGRDCRACDVLRGKGNPDRDWSRCPQGHLFDEENTYTDKKNKRHCRACGRARQRKRYQDRKDASIRQAGRPSGD